MKLRIKLVTCLLATGSLKMALCQGDVVFDDNVQALLPKTETCEKAKDKANSDEKSGIIRISRRQGRAAHNEHENFYRNYMVAKFGIEVEENGCLFFDFEECYNDQMRKIIQRKFGMDFLDSTEMIVKKEYEVFKTLDQEQKKRFINFDVTYKIVDHRADYEGGLESLVKEIKNQIDFSTIDYHRKTVTLRLVIGNHGTVDKCEVLQYDFPKTNEEKIANVLKKVGGWTPAKLYGFDVRSERVMSFNF